MKNPRKIYILGPSGSGKTYLADKLSKKFDIPHYDMDDVRFVKKFSKARTKIQRKKKVDQLLKKKKWIFDARGTEWDRHAIVKADLVLWLNTPFYVRVYNILKRYFKRRKNNNFEDDFFGVLSLIKYSLSYRFGKRYTSFNPIKKFLNENNINPIILENRNQVNKFLESLK